MEVTLRDVEVRDLDVLFQHQADPVAAKMAAFPSRDREAFTAHWQRLMAARGNDGAPITKAIVVDGQVAGNVGCWEQHGERLVGYWIGREFWGRGIATRALELLLDEVPARPLHARVARTNAPSIRVLEKCGFTACGAEKVTIRGTEADELVYVRR